VRERENEMHKKRDSRESGIEKERMGEGEGEGESENGQQIEGRETSINNNKPSFYLNQ
jgi:archaellum component FlaC